MRALVPVGRALFALIFVVSIFGHFSGATIAQASAHGVPLAAFFVPFAGVIGMVGGVLVMLGYRARFGAFLLLLFLVPVTFMLHKFWGIPDPHIAALQKVMFMKNVALVGGALLIMYWGAGPHSLDG